MFTGIIKEKGKVLQAESGSSLKLKISSPKTFKIGLGDSVACNGVCLTVASIDAESFSVDVMNETLKKTNLTGLKLGDLINLEPASKMGDKLDGHVVQGHVDCVGEIANISGFDSEKLVVINFPEKFKNLVVEKGSIAIDGISLTVFDVNENNVSVSLVEFTINHTNVGSWYAGQKVNIEFDIFGKYVAKILNKEV